MKISLNRKKLNSGKNLVLALLAVFFIGAGTAAIPFLDDAFANAENSNAEVNAGKVNLQVDYNTKREGSHVKQGSLNSNEAIFEEKNITGGSEGRALLDIGLASNPAWIWFKVNQTANKENKRIKTEYNRSEKCLRSSQDREENRVVEDFEGGNLDIYSGEKDNFRISNGTSYNGNFSLASNNSKEIPYYYRIHSKNKTVENGCVIQYYSRIEYGNQGDEGGTGQFMFGYRDSGNTYKIRWQPQEGDWYLVKKENDSELILLDNDTSVQGSFSEGKWYRFRIQWRENGSITAQVIDPETGEVKSRLETVDRSFEKGEIGFVNGLHELDAEIYYDRIKTFQPEDQANRSVPEDGHSEKGELGRYLNFLVWYDDGDGELNSKEEQVIFNGTGHEFGNLESYSGPGLDKNGLLDGSFKDNSDFRSDPFLPDTKKLGIKWYLPKNPDCEAQTDEKRYDLKLVSEQSRNVPNPGSTWTEGFGDKESSNENFFRAGKFEGCEVDLQEEISEPQTEPKPEPVCGPVLGPEGEQQIERTTREGSEIVKYNAEIRNSSVKFDYIGNDGLGDSEEKETEVFTIEVDGTPGEQVYVRTKSGDFVGTAALSGVGNPVNDTSGFYTLEIEEVNELENSTQYRISVTSNGEEGSEVRELSNIRFEFCEPIEKEANWQVDLTTDQLHVPLQSQADGDLIMTAVNQTDEGDLLNPDVIRSEENMSLVDQEFKFGNGTISSRFEVKEGEKEIGLTAYELPGPYSGWKDPEANEQILHDYDFGSYSKGEHEITVDLPGEKYPNPEQLGEIRERKTEDSLVYSTNRSYRFNGSQKKEFNHTGEMELEEGSLSMNFRMDDESENWIFTKDQDGCKGDCGHLSIAHKSFINREGLGVRLQSGDGEEAILKPRKPVEEDRSYNIIVTWGMNGTRMYLNGKLHAISPKTSGIENNNLTVKLGERYDGEEGTGLKGEISNLRFYKRQLSSREIRSGANQTQ